MNRKIGVWIFVSLTLLISMIQLSIWYSNLPQQVPSHFGIDGQPDRWMSRTGYVVMIGCIQFATIGFMVMIGMLTKVLPSDLINLPNKEYWLSEKRREATIGQIQCDMLIIGAITCWLVIGIFHLTCRVASGAADSIDPYSWWFIGLYMSVIIAYCVSLFLRYRVSPNVEKG